MDKALAAGELTIDTGFDPIAERKRMNPPADAGTCIHWISQCKARCSFADPADSARNTLPPQAWDPARALACKPEDKFYHSALNLYKDGKRMETTMNAVGDAVVQHLPPASGWYSELGYTMGPGLLGGHVDFTSFDLEDIVDLKTTGKPPKAGRIKYAHAVQLCSYARLQHLAHGVLPKRLFALYADRNGEWILRTNPIMLDGSIPEHLQLYQHVCGLIDLVTSPLLDYAAVPQYDEVRCSDDFCPYRAYCQRMLPHGKGVSDLTVLPEIQNPFTMKGL